MVHSGMHTNVSFTSASLSSLAHSVRQKPSFSSMAVRYQLRRRRSGEPLRGSYPGLQRPAILMASIRMRMPSKTQTGRKMRNQFHCTCREEREKMLIVEVVGRNVSLDGDWVEIADEAMKTVTFPSNLSTSIMRKTKVKTQVNKTLWARDISLSGDQRRRQTEAAHRQTTCARVIIRKYVK